MSQRLQHLANVALPAAGAYLAADGYTPLEVRENVGAILFELSYTPASATGTPKVYVGLITAGGEMRSLVGDPLDLEEVVLPVSPSGVGVAWVYPLVYRVDRGIIGARLVIGESGDTANPGSVSVFATPSFSS